MLTYIAYPLACVNGKVKAEAADVEAQWGWWRWLTGPGPAQQGDMGAKGIGWQLDAGGPGPLAAALVQGQQGSGYLAWAQPENSRP